jgi:hypothetical protein
MFCISKTKADSGKLVLFLESTGKIYPGICSVSQTLELLGENECYFWNQQVKYTQAYVLYLKN